MSRPSKLPKAIVHKIGTYFRGKDERWRWADDRTAFVIPLDENGNDLDLKHPSGHEELYPQCFQLIGGSLEGIKLIWRLR